MKRIGMLTSGGDCQALNAAISFGGRLVFHSDIQLWLSNGSLMRAHRLYHVEHLFVKRI